MTAHAALETRRVQLRPFAESDAPALTDAAEASAAELRRRFTWASAPSYDGVGFIRRAMAEPADTAFAIVDPRMGRLLGSGALTAELPESKDRLRLSLWIRSDEAGRGLGTEAGRLLVDHAFKRLGAHRLFIRLDPANRASRKVVRKLGFRYEGCLREDKRLNGRWVDQECWGLLKTEWKKKG
jgi:RimJ/RimL family protein N-acetyltransferase